jgi:hypothetical protein
MFIISIPALASAGAQDSSALRQKRYESCGAAKQQGIEQ